MLTYGRLIGEVIRRITGQRLGEFFAAHIAGPLGADFHIGLPPSEFDRVANVVPAPAPSDPPQLDPNSVAFKTWTNPAMSAETTWTEGWTTYRSSASCPRYPIPASRLRIPTRSSP